MKRLGIYSDECNDFLPIIFLLFVKVNILVILIVDKQGILIAAPFIHMIVTLYVGVELYIAITYVVFKKIGHFCKHLR